MSDDQKLSPVGTKHRALQDARAAQLEEMLAATEDHESRTMTTGQSDRLTDDEMDLIVWILREDMKGDLGLRSNAGVYEVAGNFEPIRPRKDSAGVIQTMYVKKPKGSSKKNEMGDRMLDAAALDREANAVLKEIGEHARILWKTYVATYPEGLRASLAAFADMGPLVASTEAARKHRKIAVADGRHKGANRLEYCQWLSTRRIRQEAGQEILIDADLLAIDEIILEADAPLSAACKAVKAALKRHRTSIGQAKTKLADSKKAGNS